MSGAAERLPQALLAKATLSGREYAWPPGDIPEVIRTARALGLVNIGGQLQFRLPDATCECHWVAVDVLRGMPEGLSSAERVEYAAAEAERQFALTSRDFDFTAEGRKAFGEVLAAAEARGADLAQAACFVWYLRDESA